MADLGVDIDDLPKCHLFLITEAAPIFQLAAGMADDRMVRMARERVEDALREIATLFGALAPLDVVLGADRPYAFRNGLIFVAVGVILFVATLISERTRLRG